MKTTINNNGIKRLFTVALVLIMFGTSHLNAQTNSQRMAGKGAGSGLLLGALAGAVLGDGDFLEDAFTGAIIGGGVGTIAGALEGGRLDRMNQQKYNQLVNAFGEDNLRAYIELIKGDHDKAIALSKVAQISANENHKLSGFWIEALAEKDRRNITAANKMYQKLIKKDPDIDDTQQASLAVDQMVLELRSNRRANGV